jgi:hypothetical protein
MNTTTTQDSYSLETLEWERVTAAIVRHLRKKNKGKGEGGDKVILTPDDILSYRCFWKVILVFINGRSPIFISKEAVCKLLSPNQSFGSSCQSSPRSSSPPIFDDIHSLSHRVSYIPYFSRGLNQIPWTWYIQYDDIKKAIEMSVFFHKKDLAWHSIVRKSKRSNGGSGEGKGFELKVWGANPSFMNYLADLDNKQETKDKDKRDNATQVEVA